MAYVVLGAGGATGKECVNRMLSATSDQVKAVVREPSKYQDAFPKDSRLSIVSGDVTDASTLTNALSGAKGVIFAASGTGYWTADAVDHKGVENAAQAAKAAGCNRFVLVSSQMTSRHNRWNPIRIMLNNARWGLMDAKLAGEKALRKSGVPYTIVRPGGLSSAPGGKVKPAAAQGDKGVPNAERSISRADVAAVCVEALHNPAAKNVTVEVASGKQAAGSPAEFDAAVKELFKGLKADTA